jgi:epoxyqueuosine reductase QueG
MSEHKLADLIPNEGNTIFGVADLSEVNTADFLLEPELVRELHFAISIAVPVSSTVLATIKDHPNQLYFHHYRQLNNLLDRTALKITCAIEAKGFRALPIAASQIVDWKNQRAHLSHKRIAVAAGLGWIGRNNLLVTPQHGSRVRLATILTDMPLQSAECGMRNAECGSAQTDCGSCRACVAVCPAKAIKESAKDFDHQACYAQLKEFQRQGHVGQYICGICVRTCGPRSADRAGD